MGRFIGLILLLLCVGCGAASPTSTASPTALEALPISTEALPTSPPRPGMNYPPDPQSVVQSFLSAVQLATDEVDPTVYLTEALRAQLPDQHAVPELLGPEPFEWFEVKRPRSVDPTTVAVEATLHFALNDEQRHFTLTEDGPGLWHINAITP